MHSDGVNDRDKDDDDGVDDDDDGGGGGDDGNDDDDKDEDDANRKLPTTGKMGEDTAIKLALLLGAMLPAQPPKPPDAHACAGANIGAGENAAVPYDSLVWPAAVWVGAVKLFAVDATEEAHAPDGMGKAEVVASHKAGVPQSPDVAAKPLKKAENGEPPDATGPGEKEPVTGGY
jgi:hypothetical protein